MARTLPFLAGLLSLGLAFVLPTGADRRVFDNGSTPSYHQATAGALITP